MIKLTNVYKTYSQNSVLVHAIKNLSLEIKKREFVAITGPSGSGKSTILNLLGGLDRVSEGSIYMGDTLISELSEEEITLFRRENIGIIFQFFNLFPSLTVWENISLPLNILKKSKADINEKTEFLLKKIHMENRKEHLPAQLSGGEMQRVAIARALIVNPVYLMADEPTGNLDSFNSKEIIKLITELADEMKFTVIMVTHDENVAKNADRIIYITDGQVKY